MNFFNIADNITQFNTVNNAAVAFFKSIQTPWITKTMLFLTDMGSPGSIALYCLVIVMSMWLHKKYTHVVQFILTMGTTAFVAIGTKLLVKLPRPEGGIITEIGYSFASAHAMMAIVFFGLLIYSYKNHIRNTYIRNFGTMLVAIFVLIIGLSRVYLGVHYMTDVLAGFLIGFVIVSVSILMYERHSRHILYGSSTFLGNGTTITTTKK